MSSFLTGLASSMGPVECPFPPCRARPTPIVHRTDPQNVNAYAVVIPIHEVGGEASWFGRCPASQFKLGIGGAISEAARTHLASALRAYAQQLAERLRGERWNPVGPWEHIRSGLDSDTPLGVDPRPRPQVEPGAFFPPRPADSETDPVSPSMGATNMSSRADLKAMIASAVQAAGEAQAAASTITNALDKVDQAIESLSQQQQIAAAMTVAAIGADGNAPQTARDMLASCSRLGEITIELREAAALLRMRNEGTYRVAGRIAENGQSYSAGV